jgi:hypothetical protein
MKFAALIAIVLAGCGGIVEQALESEDADAIAPPEDDGGSPEVPGDVEVSEAADDAGRADEAEADAAEVVQPEDSAEPEDAGPEVEPEADDAGADDAQDVADSAEVLEDAPPAEDAPPEDEGSAPGCDLSADFEGGGVAPWTSWHAGISWDASGAPYAPAASGGAMTVSGWGAEHLSSSRVLAYVAALWIRIPADDPSARTRVTTPCGARVSEWLGGDDFGHLEGAASWTPWPSDEWILCEREQRCEAGALTTIARVNGVEAWRNVAPLSDCSLLLDVRQLAGLSPRVQDGDYLPRTVVGPVHADDYCFRAL